MSNSRAVRTVLIVVGAIAVIIGAVFAGQGAGLIPGSSMTGERIWLTIGLIVVVVGIVVIVLGIGRRRTR